MPPPPDALIDATVDAVRTELDLITTARSSRNIREEEDFTSQMLAAIRSGLAKAGSPGVRWDSAVLKKQTEEPSLGADFAGILSIRLRDYELTKGLLAQAKLVGDPTKGNMRDRSRLLAQAKAMLAVTPASFVFLYRRSGIVAVPAVAVVAAGGDARELPGWKFDEFFREHLRCFIGDPALRPRRGESLGMLLASLPARRLLYMDLHTEADRGFAERLAALHSTAAGGAALPPRGPE